MNDLPVFVLAAPLCSGKTETFHYMCNNQFVGIEMGSFAKELLSIDNSRRQGTVLTVKKKLELYGREAFGLRLVERLFALQRPDTKGFVISGMRSNIDMEILYAHINNRIRNIYIYADCLQRFIWSKERQRPGDPQTLMEFIRIESEEVVSGLGDLLINFDFEIIMNNGTLEDLYNNIERATQL